MKFILKTFDDVSTDTDFQEKADKKKSARYVILIRY